ncbi:hypothetical protein RSAG8_03757, partial [Rhizoctonia solani AG-8 WAC10335]
MGHCAFTPNLITYCACPLKRHSTVVPLYARPCPHFTFFGLSSGSCFQVPRSSLALDLACRTWKFSSPIIPPFILNPFCCQTRLICRILLRLIDASRHASLITTRDGYLTWRVDYGSILTYLALTELR